MKNQQLLNVVAQQAHDMEIVVLVNGVEVPVSGTDIRDGKLVLTLPEIGTNAPAPAAPKLTAKEKKAAAAKEAEAAATPAAPADSGEIE